MLYLTKSDIFSFQQQYSLLVRSPEWEVTEVCANEGVGFLAWSPLKGVRIVRHEVYCID